MLTVSMEETQKPRYDYQLDKPGKISFELNLASEFEIKGEAGFGRRWRSELMDMLIPLYVGGVVICLG